MNSLLHLSRSLALAAGLLAGWLANSTRAADTSAPLESPEIAALRREFEKRSGDALRPVYLWYEGELGRLERSSTTRGNLDAAIAARQERERFKSEQALATPGALKLALEDSRWRFNGDEALQIVFKKDGFIGCAQWERAGYVHRWQIAGPNTVAYTVVRGPASVGRRGTLVFAPDLNSFDGTNPDGVKINPSARLK